MDTASKVRWSTLTRDYDHHSLLTLINFFSAVSVFVFVSVLFKSIFENAKPKQITKKEKQK